ncbi:enoyl-CoA hydratase/carnithine racemase [Sporothrix brasiliensis 5110]|uniref:Enoyl-CoA hydratase/carnithine racemase n=1 Tax=Sporothrix brasiliensis 5110 TaxID=1398154 RepID=A0A0C2ETL3_9PEZI|nr:enoyl-CoA hydratase/carnithine racemase [Sporothrix brasiliensis 5110]KIH89854.1 enoyl-CoA hydratase/carnithine racemase [Sporothrix brasiliensis 5110]
MAAHSFSQPPTVPDVLVAFPAQHVMLVTINRPRQLNSLPSTHHAPLDRLFTWFDNEPALRCAVVTGAGRAFCAGADLKEWNALHDAAHQLGAAPQAPTARWTPAGFGGLSNRTGKKPVVAAVNGLCLGGGMEMAVNCDMVVAAQSAQFGLPEVRRGVVGIAGALPRIVRTLGRQRSAEMALTGRHYSAQDMARWGIVNTVVADDRVVAEAVAMASLVAANSPDAVVVSREGMRLGWEGIAPELATDLLERGMYGIIDGAENMKEGVLSFVEKRPAVWKGSKL